MITTLTIGIIIGALAGVSLVFVVLESTKKKYKSTPPSHTKPAKLLTVGGVVRWQGEAFVIERFAMGEDNQTDAVITNDHATLCVPVEELEEVEE